MKVTYNWLKDFVDIKIPAQALADKLTMAGLEVTSLEEKGGDFVFEIEITSNRPDWLGVVGIAREVAAITGKKLKLPQVAGYNPQVKNRRPFAIEIEDKKDCPLYTAKIIEGVKVGPSPSWLRDRLELIGCRSVNNIVDTTNYILFEQGQPLHVFDSDKLRADRIIVRRAAKDERLITIDGQEKTLSPDILVIADKEKPVAIAGVMGGKETEVTQETKNILLESAVFNPVVVRKGRQRLGLQTDSAYRFERGVCLASAEGASQQACVLIRQIAAGRCVLAAASSRARTKIRQVALGARRVNEILGVNIAAAELKKILNNLDFKTKIKSKNNFKVEVPSHRQDVISEIDLIEEVARISGYEAIPKTLPKIAPRALPFSKRDFVALVKDTLAGLGLNEAITYSLCDKELLKSFALEKAAEPVEILNPLSSDQEVLRTAILPSLSSCVARNLNQRQEFVNIFEIAGIFLGSQTEPKQELVLGICICGTKSLLLEQGLIKEGVGLLHLKGILERLFARLGITDYSFDIKDACNVADISVNQEKTGYLLKLQREALARLGIKNKDVFGLEISLDKLFTRAALKKKYTPAPKYPGIIRDISLILKEDIPVKEILDAIKEKSKPLLREVSVTDYYKGEQIPSGYRGLTISCLYRSDERTLTEAEISPLYALSCNALTEGFGVKVR